MKKNIQNLIGVNFGKLVVLLFIFSCSEQKKDYGKNLELSVDNQLLTDSALTQGAPEEPAPLDIASSDESVETSDISSGSLTDEQGDANSDGNGEVVKYDSYSYPRRFSENFIDKGPSDVLDFRDRDDDKFIAVKFSDGQSGTLVLRNGDFYNYTIRESTEVRFASKEDGLQKIWEDSRMMERTGEAIGGALSRKSGPRKKDGSADMRYKENR